MPTYYNAPQTKLLDHMRRDLDAGKVTVSSDSHMFFDRIAQNFSLEGSKIAWGDVPGHIAQTINYDHYEDSVTNFFDMAVSALELIDTDVVVVVGDSALDVALMLPVDLLHKYLVSIVELPQHTYFLPRDAYWCICYTLEGFMDFGFSPDLTKLIE